MPYLLQRILLAPPVRTIVSAANTRGEDADGICGNLLLALAQLLGEWARVDPIGFQRHRGKLIEAVNYLHDIAESNDPAAELQNVVRKQLAKEAAGAIVLRPAVPRRVS